MLSLLGFDSISPPNLCFWSCATKRILQVLGDMDLPSLVVILQGALSPNPSERKAAEESLNQVTTISDCFLLEF